MVSKRLWLFKSLVFGLPVQLFLSIIHIIRTEARSPVSSGWINETNGSVVPIKMILLIIKTFGLLQPPWTIAHQVPNSMEFSRQEY